MGCQPAFFLRPYLSNLLSLSNENQRISTWLNSFDFLMNLRIFRMNIQNIFFGNDEINPRTSGQINLCNTLQERWNALAQNNHL